MVTPVARLPARLKAAIAAQRSMPKMHWRWRRRGRDIVALLQSRFGSALPDDDAGADAAKLLAQHYMRLNIDAERVTRANLRLWDPRATEKTIAHLIRGARKSKTPSAAQLGKDFRVTVGEVASLGLSTVIAFSVTLEGDRVRQARRRRNAGAAKKRGRPSLELSAGEKCTRTNAQAAKRGATKRRRDGSVSREEYLAANSKSRAEPWKSLNMSRPTYFRKLRAGLISDNETSASRKNSHTVAYIGGMKRDEFSVTDLSHSVPCTMIASAIDLDGIDFDFRKFGITSITLMRGTDILRRWTAPVLA